MTEEFVSAVDEVNDAVLQNLRTLLE